MARGLPLLTRLANRYWRAGRGRVGLAELMEIGAAELRGAIAQHDPRSAVLEDFLAPRVHRALSERVAELVPAPLFDL